MYPLYPGIGITLEGVGDLFVHYELVLLDGYTLSPPAPKRYTVDVPGGNGIIDLTDVLLDDTAYSNRKQKFKMALVNNIDSENEDRHIQTLDEIEALKTKISNVIHGKKFRYKLSFDPEYWYVGRFEISTYSYEQFIEGKVLAFEVSVESDPFKYKDKQVVKFNGAGGYEALLPTGRYPTIPKITLRQNAYIIINDIVKKNVKAGVVEDEDFIFRYKENGNPVYINTGEMLFLTWGDLADRQVTWGEFKTKKLYVWYKDGHDPSTVFPDPRDALFLTWGDLIDRETTWDDISTTNIYDLCRDGHLPPQGDDDPRTVIIEYEWGDL